VAAPAPLKKVMKHVLDDLVEKAKAKTEVRLKKFGSLLNAIHGCSKLSYKVGSCSY